MLWSFPSGISSSQGSVAVALELLETELLVGQGTSHGVYHDLPQPGRPLVIPPHHIALASRPHPQLQLAQPHRHRLLAIRRGLTALRQHPPYRSVAQNQAISRAYRMGQTRKVFVHRLLCTDTIDERIMQILANKQRIFDAFADRSVAAEQVDQAFSRETMDQIVRDELRKYAGAR